MSASPAPQTPRMVSPCGSPDRRCSSSSLSDASPSQERQHKKHKTKISSIHEALDKLSSSIAATNSSVFALTKHIHSIKPPAPPPADENLYVLQEEEDDEDSTSESSYDPHNPSAGLENPSDASDNPTPSCSTDTPVTLALNSNKISLFLETLKPSFGSMDPQTPKTMPFSLHHKPGTESALILAFASAPKLPKNAHKLDGLLAGYITEVPDTLRKQDFQARQHLHGLLMNHKLLKFQEQIAHQALPVCHDPCIKDISRVIGSGSLPLVQPLISNQLLIAKQILLQLRSKAASSVKTHI